MDRFSARQISGNLLVRDRQDGPVIYAKWRDANGRQVMRKLGPGWLVPVGDSNAKPSGGQLGDWVERRGRPPVDALDIRGAYEAMSTKIQDHEDEIAAEVRQREALSRTDVTFREAAEAWLDWGCTEREWKHSTASDYRCMAGRVSADFADKPLTEFTEADLRTYLASFRIRHNGRDLERRPSARSRMKYTVVIRAVFAYAEEQRWVERSPAQRLKVVKPRRYSKNHPVRREEYLTPEEVQAIVRAATPDDGAFFLTLAYAGLRLGEGLALQWQDVNFAGSSLIVERSITLGVVDTPKGGGGRTVPMADEVARALARLSQRGVLTGDCDPVFINRHATGIADRHSVRRRFYAIQEEVGIQPRRTLHQLRHTFATVCASRGIPLRTIQGWCGHENYATTERYAHLMPRSEDAALVSAAFAPRSTTPSRTVVPQQLGA
jgi:integrase